MLQRFSRTIVHSRSLNAIENQAIKKPGSFLPGFFVQLRNN
jgi:hypothetical protein